jgi:hypothetical protein
MSKKPEQKPKETISQVVDRGLSNTCQLALHEDALKNQMARLEVLEKVMPCAMNGHKWEYGVSSAAAVRRTCLVCGKSDWVHPRFRLILKFLGKLSKLFKD